MKKRREGRGGPKEGKPHLEALLCGAACAQRQLGAEGWYLGGLCVIDPAESQQERCIQSGTSRQCQRRFRTLRVLLVLSHLQPLQFGFVVPFSLSDGQFEIRSMI